ncbi:hypothetical protein B0T16DRAFT_428243 [Cercophora newfieldiana]|uniref:Uncharacterized protein n=1 Tax=Cercophora newfieldiana TaxID=92897 RepID=A0AA39YBD0_9PEZI|nr:hypothetical protein B0T16DRAFT_428243 [Cercophora newfieldiana]
MAPSKKARLGGNSSRGSSKQSSTTSSSSSDTLPKPFKAAPTTLEPLYAHLNPHHIYLAHIDSRPRDFKRKIFLVPVAMNLAVALLFAWRLYAVAPYYLQLFASTIGYPNELTIRAAEMEWQPLLLIILHRSLTFILDFLLFIFVWPWPYEFAVGGSASHGAPLGWRWQVGFRDQEIYVRRSRSWDMELGDLFGAEGSAKRNEFWSRVGEATNPLLLQQKTGYLLMDGAWDLDWDAMVLATSLVDTKKVELDEFMEPVVLLHSEKFGWVTIDRGDSKAAGEEERRKQVFAFRDALAKLDKEDLFFRWIEIVQFETSKPGVFGAQRQHEVAEQIRELFTKNGVDFDKIWGEVVAKTSTAGAQKEDTGATSDPE